VHPAGTPSTEDTMRNLLNLIWLLLCGIWLAIGYLFAGVVCCILIITIPFGLASFRIANFAIWPSGRQLVRRPDAIGVHDRQHHLVRLRRLVAGARPSRHRGRTRRHDRGHPVRLGSPQARRARALADRQGHRPD
jgi:hypothetical protein